MIYILIIFMILFVAALVWAVILKSENHDLKDKAITLKVLKNGKWLGADEWRREVTQEVEQWKEKYRNENRLYLNTRIDLDNSKKEVAHYLKKVSELQQKLDELQSSKPMEAQESQEEQGTFVRTRRVKRATPETYRIVFDLDVNGQRVLEHLTMVFCKDAFVPDDKGGERQTSYNLGAQGVINFIVNNINTANNPNYEEQDND